MIVIGEESFTHTRVLIIESKDNEFGDRGYLTLCMGDLIWFPVEFVKITKFKFN